MKKFWSYSLTGLKALVAGLLLSGLMWVLNSFLVLIGIGAGIMGAFTGNVLWLITGLIFALMFLTIYLVSIGFIYQKMWKWK